MFVRTGGGGGGGGRGGTRVGLYYQGLKRWTTF